MLLTIAIMFQYIFLARHNSHFKILIPQPHVAECTSIFYFPAAILHKRGRETSQLNTHFSFLPDSQLLPDGTPRSFVLNFTAYAKLSEQSRVSHP